MFNKNKRRLIICLVVLPLLLMGCGAPILDTSNGVSLNSIDTDNLSSDWTMIIDDDIVKSDSPESIPNVNLPNNELPNDATVEEINTSDDVQKPASNPSGEVNNAVKAFHEFLLNQRTLWSDSGDTHSGRVYRYIHYNILSDKFSILDSDGDGVPELHINARNYYIFTYENGEVQYFLRQGSNERSTTVLLNNMALFTVTKGAHGNQSYIYRELGGDGIVMTLEQLENTSDGCWIDNVKVAVEDYLEAKESLFEHIEAVKSDMIPWQNYSEWYSERIDEYVPIEQRPDASETLHSSDASEYSIESVSFREGRIEIDYPQICDYRDGDVESIINNDIKIIAFEQYNEYKSSALLSELSLHVYGEVTFTGKEIICVRFTGYRYVDGSPYPVSSAYSATYDLGSGNRLEIGDFVANASEFVNVFKEHAKAVAVGGDYIDEDLAKAFSRVLFEDVENGRVYTNDELMTTIFGDEGMGKPGAGLYFTDGNLCLLFPVHRNAGTSIEMEIDLKLLPSSILKRSIL